ncbi:MAG: hypothetical protein AAF194_04105, partial [Pseudomonadota bacterium]
MERVSRGSAKSSLEPVQAGRTKVTPFSIEKSVSQEQLASLLSSAELKMHQTTANHPEAMLAGVITHF